MKMYMWYIIGIPLLFATVVLADYYIDNANTSVQYSMASSQSGQAWQTFSVGTQSLALTFSNSTGNYTITLDASLCYDENYSLGKCGTNDNCFVQLPFTGSGITMYVFSAGLSGMTASFSVDGGTAVSNTIQAPPPPTYQVSNVSLYDIQGLSSGNHTMRMTILDWNGDATSMKFDYAHVNETLVAPPAATTAITSITATSTSQAATSQTPTQTSAGNSSTSNKVNIGAAIGGALAGVIIVGSVVIGFFYFRKRKAPRREENSPESIFQVNLFRSQHHSSPVPPSAPYAPQRSFFTQHPEATSSVSPLQRSAILRDALAASNYLSEPIQRPQSFGSESSSPALQPLRRQTSHNADADLRAHSRLSYVADAGSPFADPSTTSGYDLTTEQLEIIDRLRMDKVPAETIRRVVEGFVSSRVPVGETSSEVTRGGSILSAVPPPSYQTRAA